MFDWKITNARIVDYKNQWDFFGEMGFENGRIAAIGPAIEPAKKTYDAQEKLVIPGVIDAHMHASSWAGGPGSYRMMAAAGVTSALEMAGPVQSVKEFVASKGCGMNIGCLEMICTGYNVEHDDPSKTVLSQLMDRALQSGAYGVKFLGGHFPLTPHATSDLIALGAEKQVYVGIHAGTTKKGSNIEGVEEIFELAQGHPFHLAHVNAYCRGNVRPLWEECRRAAELLETHPEVDSESYLSPINGTCAKCIDGIPIDHVTKTCLAKAGYPVTEQGLEKAIADGYGRINVVADGITYLGGVEEGQRFWREKKTDTFISFPVNPGLSRFFFATQKRANDRFVVDAFCTDGGGIPRNVIIANGLSLVKFGALSLPEFVLKSSFAAASLLGLTSKGHLSVGADADVTVIDWDKQAAVASFIGGEPALWDGKVIARPGRMFCSQEGEKSLAAAGIRPIVICDYHERLAQRKAVRQ